MRLVIGMAAGAIVTSAILVHGSLSQGAVLTLDTWPVFVVIGAPIALLGGICGMLIFGLTER